MTLRTMISATAIAVTLSATDSLASTPSQTFDHSSGQNQSKPVSAAAGDTITITITNTCPEDFQYAALPSYGTPSQALAPTTSGGRGPAAENARKCPRIDSTFVEKLFSTWVAKSASPAACKATSTNLYITHYEKYGGYNIQIKKGPNAPVRVVVISSDAYTGALKQFTQAYTTQWNGAPTSESCDEIGTDTTTNAAWLSQWTQTTSNLPELKEQLETVTVTNAVSAIELAGGVTVSNLRDSKYTLVNNPSGSGQILAENTAAEDRRKIGATGFIHVHNPNCYGSDGWVATCNHVAMSLGFGVSTSNSLSIFVGPSYRFAGQWFVTAGYNWGATTTLPASDRVGQPPSSASVLTNLSTHTTGAFFFALSYAFLNPGASFFTKEISSSPQATQAPTPSSK